MRGKLTLLRNGGWSMRVYGFLGVRSVGIVDWRQSSAALGGVSVRLTRKVLHAH